MSQFHALPHTATFLEARAPRKALLSRLTTALTVARTRRALAQMDAASLADIGLSSTQVRTEMRRPFWDIAPQCVR